MASASVEFDPLQALQLADPRTATTTPPRRR
jgi:hypothetical protein